MPEDVKLTFSYNESQPKCSKLKEEIRKLKEEANETSMQVETLNCKIKRAEFIKMAEEEERKRLRMKMEGTKAKVLAAQARWASPDESLKQNKAILRELTESKDKLLMEADSLRATVAKGQSMIIEKKRALFQLKKKQAAMMMSLNEQKRTYEKQIVKYSDMLGLDHQQLQ